MALEAGPATLRVFNRILLSIIWFGVNAWQGGLVTYVCLRAIWPSIDKIHNTIPASEGMTLPQFVSFIVFYVLMLPFLYLPPQYLKYVVYTTSLAAFVAQLGLVGWACGTAENLSAALKASSPPAPSGQLGWLFLYGISTTMSSITSGTLSICDYTRFAKEPQSGIWSQLVGAVPAWISNVFGLLTIAATSTRYHAAQWSVPTLLVAVQDADKCPRTRAAVFFCAFAFFANQIALNIIGNSFSGGTDMASLLPRWINIRRGQYLTAVLGLATNPWRLLSSAGVFLTVISGYTVFVQPFIGILVGYYFIVYKQRVLIEHLYRVGKDSSIYWYFHGVNWRAIFAWLVGVVPHLPGFLHAVSSTIWVSNGAAHLYQLTSITSSLFAFLTTVLLAYLFPVKSQAEYVQSSDRDTSVLRSAQFADQMYYTPGLEIRKEVSLGSDQDEEKLAGMKIEGEAFKVRLSAEMT
ncbi:hypothetical protein M409DRAFT_37668 [Zasmidium cellare ATCC 36951]|uniref:Uracil permease n=1 Tax=Zasmidium cellare ATCC 36951 TaxID=1080233 RepID=A0A6A6C1K8_ZASCE|nr:uncharacterized protein M409DRAFT_37668 [Zasmidium cellare ATCC 36951]KAF2160901.1 hypothetical protein M409DRAFT_37668 [Zasmidium cellare ATCC 36951]